MDWLKQYPPGAYVGFQTGEIQCNLVGIFEPFGDNVIIIRTQQSEL